MSNNVQQMGTSATISDPASRLAMRDRENAKERKRETRAVPATWVLRNRMASSRFFSRFRPFVFSRSPQNRFRFSTRVVGQSPDRDTSSTEGAPWRPLDKTLRDCSTMAFSWRDVLRRTVQQCSTKGRREVAMAGLRSQDRAGQPYEDCAAMLNNVQQIVRAGWLRGGRFEKRVVSRKGAGAQR